MMKIRILSFILKPNLKTCTKSLDLHPVLTDH